MIVILQCKFHPRLFRKSGLGCDINGIRALVCSELSVLLPAGLHNYKPLGTKISEISANNIESSITVNTSTSWVGFGWEVSMTNIS